MTRFNLFKIPHTSAINTHICVCTENYIVVPVSRDGSLAVWQTSHPFKTPTTLYGHHKPVTALALSNYPSSYYLCSCSSDNIILWNLLQSEGLPKNGQILPSQSQEPIYCCFNSDNSKIGISFSNEVWIFSLKENRYILLITELHFTVFNFNSNGLIGIEDNYIKIWKAETNEITTAVTLSSGFPTDFYIFEPSDFIVVGSTHGHVYVYNRNYRLFRNISIWRVISQNRRQKGTEENLYDDIRIDCFPVHAIHVFHLENENVKYFPKTAYLLIVSTTCLFILNLNNEAVLFFLDFNNKKIDLNPSVLGLIRSATISTDSNNTLIFICLVPVIGESIFLLRLFLEKIFFSNECNSIGSCIKKNSHPLTFQMLNDSEGGKSLLAHSMGSNKKVKNIKKSTSNLNQPITFHSNIKSSGYGILHKPFVLFNPQLSKNRRCRSLNFLPSKSLETKSDSAWNSNHMDKDVTYTDLKFLGKTETCGSSAFSYLHTTVDGQYACCPVKNGLVDIFKIMNKSLKVQNTISCHAGEVNSAKWSHTGKMFITSGNDKTVKIWDLEQSKQLQILTIGHEKIYETSPKKKKFMFEECVTNAQFYYLDRFILTTSGNKLYLFDYDIDIKKSGIKSYVNKSRIKLVEQISLESKQISYFAAVNQYFSNLVLCVGSSKCIDTIDMAVGKIVWHSEIQGCKTSHVIAINEGSPYINQEATMQDLFLTSAMFDGIKVWDLRTKEPVLCYKEHKCQSFPCSSAFSPCGKFIVSGSENKSVYIYDLRQVNYLEKITEPSVDVFISAAFSPKSQIILSTLNGFVYLYGKM